MWNHDREIFFCDLCGASIADTPTQRSIDEPLLVLAYHTCSRVDDAEQVWSVKRARKALKDQLNFHRIELELLLQAFSTSTVSATDVNRVRDDLIFACEQWSGTVRSRLEVAVQRFASNNEDGPQFNASILELGGALAHIKSLKHALTAVLGNPLELIHRVLSVLRESILLAQDSKGDKLEERLRLILYRVFFNPFSYSFEFHWIEPYPAFFELASSTANRNPAAAGKGIYDLDSMSFSVLLALLERVALSEARKQFPSFYL